MASIQQQQQRFLFTDSDPGDKVSISPTTPPSPIPSPSSSSEASAIAKVMGLRHWQSQPLLRTKASTQLTPFHAQAQPCHSSQSPSFTNSSRTTNLDVPKQSHTSSSIAHAAAKTHSSSEWNRTQHKLMLQRQSFLANDKHHLDYPANMKRLTKEMDRMNREYRCVRHYEDPMAESFLRVTMAACHHHPIMQSSPQLSSLSSSSTSSSTSSSLSSSGVLDLALSTTRNICNSNNSSSSSNNHHIYSGNVYYGHHQQQQQQQHQQQQPLGKVSSPILQRRASDFMLKQHDRRNSSTSIHSAIIERSHHQSPASTCSKNYFFTRWFKPSLPLTTKRHQLHPTC